MPYWLWIGNIPQVNTDKTTSVTQTEANTLRGYIADGSTQPGQDGMAPVWMDGEIKLGAFQAHYNPNVPGGTRMAYESPHAGDVVLTDNVTPTALISGTVRVGEPDGAGGMTYTVKNAVFIQMSNGDLFFRPTPTETASWDTMDRIASIEVLTATTTTNTTAINSTAGFNPGFADIEVVCFTRGTRIKTRDGETAVEALRVGDPVLTMDHGYQPIRWIGLRRLDRAALSANPNLRPIRIRGDALGGVGPDLTVSPQHRILLRGALAERMFGVAEVLVAAKHLTALDGVDIVEDGGPVDYWHFMCDAHEVVFANGRAAESLYAGPGALRGLDQAAREELLALFPELARGAIPAPARHLVPGRRGRQMAARLARNPRGAGQVAAAPLH